MDMHLKLSEGTRIYQYLSTMAGCLGVMSSVMHYGWPSPSLSIIESGNYTFQMTDEEDSWLAVMPLTGAVLGASAAGISADVFGRKLLILSSSIYLIAAWMMIGWARVPLLLFIPRFLGGLAEGILFTVFPMYLGEVAEPEIRGLLSSICSVSVVLGILLINIIGSHLSISATAFLSSSIPLFMLFTLLWMPESPYFLLMQDRHDEARQSLQLLRGSFDVNKELEHLTKAVKDQFDNSGKCLELFTVRSNRKAMVIALGLRTAQEVAGATVMDLYCETIFAKADTTVPASTAAIIFFTIQLVLCAISSFIVDISGRRPLIIFSVAGTAVTLSIIGVYFYLEISTNIDMSAFSFILLLGMVCYIFIFSCGLHSIPFIIIGEVFPTNVKALALCLTDVYYDILGTITAKYFNEMTNNIGIYVPLFTFSAFSVIACAMIFRYIPETKGKTLEEIQECLKQ